MSIRLTRIYTRTGDDGSTALVGGERVRKTALQVEAYGTADELNSVLGLLRTMVDQLQERESALARESRIALPRLQNKLFDLGSLLACPLGSDAGSMPKVTDEDVAWLEQRMDDMNADLPELRSFVLPGGGMLNAYAHLARTVCRRLERVMWAVNDEAGGGLDPTLLTWVNRLSDYLFVYARWAALRCGETEYLWEHPLR
jgi:cob(I)alamin adenosyltransferase